jgi:hypothetical protein
VNGANASGGWNLQQQQQQQQQKHDIKSWNCRQNLPHFLASMSYRTHCGWHDA